MNIIPRIATQPKNIAFLYHDDDEKWKNELKGHLTLMRRQGLISIIERSLEMPPLDLILILVSPSLMGDDTILNAINYALAHKPEGQKIIPIIVRQTSLADHPIAPLRKLPRNGKPVNEQNKDKAFSEIADEIRLLVTGNK